MVSTAVCSALVAYSFIPQKNREKALQKFARLWSIVTLRVNRIKVHVHGKSNLPAHGPLIIVSNHQGNADIPILTSNLPYPIRFFIKKELFWVPIFGWYLKRAGYLAIDRGSGAKAKKTLEHTIAIIKRGEFILIFPEGTRTRTGEIGKFKSGAAFLAQESGAPILPIRIKGSFEIQKRGKFTVNPGASELFIGKPLKISQTESLIEATKKIEAAVKSLGNTAK